MADNFKVALDLMLKEEGFGNPKNPNGFSNDPKDPGGMTAMGVTRATWQEYLGRVVSESEMRALDLNSVRPLYKTRYWDKCSCDKLPSGVDILVFDMAVNLGPFRASCIAQSAVGVKADGKIGPVTLEVINKSDPIKTIDEISKRRQLYYESRPKYSRFGTGWTKRVVRVKAASIRMATATIG